MQPITTSQSVALAIGLLGSMGQAATVEFVETGYEFSADERAAIAAIGQATVSEVRDVLPQLPEEVRLSVSAGTQVIPQIGATAQVLAPGHIRWTVDPSRPEGVTAVAERFLRSTLVHELHHVARMQAGFTLDTVMDLVVAEGLGVTFDRDFTKQSPALGLADYPGDVDGWVKELLALPESLEVAFSSGAGAQWMFRHPDGRQWIVYRAGTYVVDRAMEASGLTAAQLVATPSQEILALAGFD